ncbi:MAG: polyketide synthase, partial [Deltaproteobacteria bacterium]
MERIFRCASIPLPFKGTDQSVSPTRMAGGNPPDREHSGFARSDFTDTPPPVATAVAGGISGSRQPAGAPARPTGAGVAYRPEIIRGIAREVERGAVAVVGMGFLLPGAEAHEERFWELLRTGEVAITKVPDRVWPPARFLDPSGTDPTRSYTDLGAFLPDRPFPARRFRIPPASVPLLDKNQCSALEAAAAALADAGNPQEDPEIRRRTDVILGMAQGDDLRERTAARIMLDALERDGGMKLPLERLGFPLPQVREDSMPGELANVVAGRIAATFDLSGANFTVDAACAGSLVALATAIDRLRSGRADWILSGGIDRNMGIAAYTKFCRLGALSRHGSFPFDRRADGFVMGEGGAVFVLRRLSDALRDGQRIRAIILGAGTASDGRGKGITAPN